VTLPWVPVAPNTSSLVILLIVALPFSFGLPFQLMTACALSSSIDLSY